MTHPCACLQGFKLIFEFSDNPFFSNKELVKTYYMVSDDAADPVLQKATGTSIQWASGKNPGVKVSPVLPCCVPQLTTALVSKASNDACLTDVSLQGRSFDVFGVNK